MNKFEKLIELIVNEDEKQAQKLFHEIVVEKSRTIYESLLDEEDYEDIEDIDDEVDADEEGVSESLKSVISVEEAKQLLDHIDGTLNESDSRDLLQRVAEHFGVEVEGLVPVLESNGDALLEMAYGEDEEVFGGEEDFGGDEFGGEEADFDDSGDLDTHELDHVEDDASEEEIEDRVVDLEDALDELKAEFDALIGDEGMDMEDEEGFDADVDADADGEEEMDDVEDLSADVADDDDLEESLVREYVEKVSPKVTDSEEDSPNTKSTVAGKNDMGGTTANIVGDQSEETGDKADTAAGLKHSEEWKNKGGKGTKNSKQSSAPKATNKKDSEKSILDGPKGK